MWLLWKKTASSTAEISAWLRVEAALARCQGELGIIPAESAAATAQKTFEQGGLGGDLPTLDIAASALSDEALIDQFVATGLCASKGEARRHIKAGALKVNDEAVSEERNLSASDVRDGSVKLSIGKKKHAIIRVT